MQCMGWDAINGMGWKGYAMRNRGQLDDGDAQAAVKFSGWTRTGSLAEGEKQSTRQKREAMRGRGRQRHIVRLF